jgi:hypothetical protein
MAQLPTQSQFGDYGEWPGRDVLDSGGERLGGVREIYLDRETGRPEWVLVDLEGDEARFVPLADAEVADATIRVAHSADTIRNAPGIGTEPRIDQSEERKLYEHYGIGYSTEESPSGLPAEEPATVEQEAVEPSSWSEAAPAPPEPSSPDEIERAEHPEPEVVSPSAAGPSAEPEAQVTPVAEPVPPPESVLISPAATSEPPEELKPPEPATPPPPPPAPEPPTPPRATQPPEPEPGGPLEAVKDNKAGLAIGLAIAAVLLLVIRKLR